ncbi:MAG: CRISPR-associated protein Cas4 [Adlercreutzia sp.]|nr:CRISPR-associated protein Cas4 [Adlercreutzia sp.]
MYTEDNCLPLSGIQHFAFCRRQWALIHVEQQWGENLLTAQGSIMHNRAHDECLRERRGGLITVRGLAVHSLTLGLTGKCDVVEFRQTDHGVPLAREEGLWSATPIEYKRGKAKTHDADRLQLCAQALCLEEMLACDIPVGYLYYGSTHTREKVPIDSDLRACTTKISQEMHRYFSRRFTPAPKLTTACRSCSLEDQCLPTMAKKESVAAYMARRLKEET